jgi:hypothetical protein
MVGRKPRYKQPEEVEIGDCVSTPPGSRPSFTFVVRSKKQEGSMHLFYTEGLDWPVKVQEGMQMQWWPERSSRRR